MKITLTQDDAKSVCLEYFASRTHGLPIEVEITPSDVGPEWFNPDNLTPEQVGVSEGWRLLTVDEVSSESREYPETQWYRKGVWQRTSTWNASREGCCTLRTKHPIGYYKR